MGGEKSRGRRQRTHRETEIGRERKAERSGEEEEAASTAATVGGVREW